MATLDPIDCRQRIQAALVAALGADGWAVSSQPYDMFPGADLRDREGLSFAVGLPSSSALPGRQSRQSGGFIPVITVVGVRFSVSLASDGAVADYDRGLLRERELVTAVRLVSGPGREGGPDTAFVSVERRVVEGTLFVGDARFQVVHPYPLQP